MCEPREDGGPAFPFHFPTPMSGDASESNPGMSQRALFAAILMHAELVTDGVPGAACDALVEASIRDGREVEDQMAFNAVVCADALLRALAEPIEEPRKVYDPYGAPGAEKEALKKLHAASYFNDLPADMRAFVASAAHQIHNEENDIPF